jgi:hypothetical protein
VGGVDIRVFGGDWDCCFATPNVGSTPRGRVIDKPELLVSGLATVEGLCGMAGVILKFTFLPGDDGSADAGLEGIRSDRGGVLGVHFAVDSPSFGGCWENAFLSVSAIMLFISCLEKSLSRFR